MSTPAPDAHLTRRLFTLLGLGTLGTAAVTACQVQTGNRDTDTEPGEDDTAVNNPDRVFHAAFPYVAPPTGHFNYAPGVMNSINLSFYNPLFLPPGGLWDWAGEEWLLLLAESYEFTEQEFSYRLRPDLTWSDGSALTSEDVEWTFWVRWLLNQQEWPMISGIERTDDHSVTFALNDPSVVLERRVLKAPILPAVTYGEFGQRAKELFEDGEATDSGAVGELRDELLAWRPDAADVLFSGPYALDLESITDAQLAMNRNDQGVLSEAMTFERIIVFNGETEDITPLVLDGTIDYATHGFTASTQQQWERAGLTTRAPAFYTGCAVLMSQGNRPEFADVRVRQALAHAVDREEATVIAMDAAGTVSETMSGMPSTLAELWLDDEVASELQGYPYDQDRASELLEEAGWQLTGGRWHTPDGVPAEYAFTFQSDFAGYSATARYYTEMLNDFGMSVELNGIESASIPERVHTGQFDFATMAWGGDEPHPHYAYTSVFINDNEPVSRNHGGRGIDYGLQQDVEGLGEVDIHALVTASGEGLDLDRQREQINQLALIFNRQLPKIPVWERLGNNPVNEGPRVLAFPAEDDPIWASAAYSDNPVVQALYRGLIHPS